MTLLETFGGRGIGRCRACQLAAMRVAGHTVEDMRKETGLTAEIIEEFFRWWDNYNNREMLVMPRLTEETKQAIIAEREATGATYEQLAEKFGTTSRTVCKIINEKKSPPQPEAVADSKDMSSHENNTTKDIKGQALKGIDMLGVLQGAIENAYGSCVKVTSFKADSDTAFLMFRYKGVPCIIGFGRLGGGEK